MSIGRSRIVRRVVMKYVAVETQNQEYDILLRIVGLNNLVDLIAWPTSELSKRFAVISDITSRDSEVLAQFFGPLEINHDCTPAERFKPLICESGEIEPLRSDKCVMSLW